MEGHGDGYLSALELVGEISAVATARRARSTAGDLDLEPGACRRLGVKAQKVQHYRDFLASKRRQLRSWETPGETPPGLTAAIRPRDLQPLADPLATDAGGTGREKSKRAAAPCS